MRSRDGRAASRAGPTFKFRKNGTRATASAEAERPQLTVLFRDLVGSTALAERLDPEQLRDLMQAYQGTCGEVISRYDGHVAQYLGDGLMVYFGWPQAHEDDAARALLAGLEISDVYASNQHTYRPRGKARAECDLPNGLASSMRVV